MHRSQSQSIDNRDNIAEKAGHILKIGTIYALTSILTSIFIIDSWSAKVEPFLLGNTPFTPILAFSLGFLEYLRCDFQRVMPSDDAERERRDAHAVTDSTLFHSPAPPRRVQCAKKRDKSAAKRDAVPNIRTVPRNSGWLRPMGMRVVVH